MEEVCQNHLVISNVLFSVLFTYQAWIVAVRSLFKPVLCLFFFGHVVDKKYYLLVFFQAVANSTSATFLRVVGSELIQKYLGDGPKLVRELFRVADDLSPSIVFIDEIDAVGTKRYV